MLFVGQVGFTILAVLVADYFVSIWVYSIGGVVPLNCLSESMPYYELIIGISN